VPTPNTMTVKATSVDTPSLSGSSTVTLLNPAPAITSVSPNTINTGLAYTLTVNGRGFLSTSKVTFAGAVVTANILSDTQLTFAGTSTAAVGTILDLTVANPDPGAATSGTAHVTVLAPITVDAPRPTSAVIRAGATQQFTATVHNNSNHGLTWAV